MSKIFEASRKSFLEELNSQGDLWRVFRVGTLVDMLTSHLLMYQKNRDSIHLVNAFNTILKLDCDRKLAKIQLHGSLQQSFSQFNRDLNLVIRAYDECLADVQQKLAASEEGSANSINDSISYLKILSQLALDDFNNQIVSDLACTIANEFDLLVA